MKNRKHKKYEVNSIKLYIKATEELSCNNSTYKANIHKGNTANEYSLESKDYKWSQVPLMIGMLEMSSSLVGYNVVKNSDHSSSYDSSSDSFVFSSCSDAISCSNSSSSSCSSSSCSSSSCSSSSSSSCSSCSSS